jgi:hypothetical protein
MFIYYKNTESNKERMKIRLSHTRAQIFKACPQKDHLRYDLHIKPKEHGASLDFGGSIDVAISYLLSQDKQDAISTGYKDVFEKDLKHGWNLAYDDCRIRYKRTDYDALVIASDQDQEQINTWEAELNISSFDVLAAEKVSKYKRFDGIKLQMFNRLCWLSMKRKGHLMLEAFVRDIYSKIKKVIAIQHEFKGDVNGNTEVIGIIDLICEFEGYSKPIILDIKTSAQYYDEHKPLYSEQLMLYLGALGKDLATNYTGFLVMLKAIDRDSVCSKCGNKKSTKHQTCPVIINDKRCDGAWSEVPIGRTQIQIEDIPQDKVDTFMNSFANLADLMNMNRPPYMNWESCDDFGMCDYWFLCHKNDRSKYVFPEDRIKLPVINQEIK